MAPTIFTEKNFARVFMDVHGYGTISLDRIRERNWFELVYDNEDSDVYYFPNLITQFYTHIDSSTIDHDLHTFIVHFDSGDLIVNINTIEMITKIHCPPQYDAPLPLIRIYDCYGCKMWGERPWAQGKHHIP